MLGFISLKPVAESPNSLGGVPHKAGKLAATTKQQQHNRSDDYPMHRAETAHVCLLLIKALAAGDAEPKLPVPPDCAAARLSRRQYRWFRG
jgi:hypothetical protein